MLETRHPLLRRNNAVGLIKLDRVTQLELSEETNVHRGRFHSPTGGDATPEATDFASFAPSTGDPTIRDGFPIFLARSSAESLSVVGFVPRRPNQRPLPLMASPMHQSVLRSQRHQPCGVSMCRSHRPVDMSFFPAVSTHQDSPKR